MKESQYNSSVKVEQGVENHQLVAEPHALNNPSHSIAATQLKSSSGVTQLAKSNPRKNKKRSVRKVIPSGPSKTIVKPKPKRNRYTQGMHGYKTREQQRLSAAHGITVNGNTHESEHTIGFEVLNRSSGNQRGVGAEARTLENIAPAYQEVKAQHRQHIGTGTTSQIDGSGFNSHTYRNTQRSLLESGDVSSAVQINQLGYAHHPGFAAASGTSAGRAANNSYNAMVANMGSVTYANGASQVSVPVDGRQRAEMHLARRATQTGRYPTVEEENEARRRFGVQEYGGS